MGSIREQAEGALINLPCLDAVKDRIEEGWEEGVDVAHHSEEDGGASFPALCRMG